VSGEAWLARAGTRVGDTSGGYISIGTRSTPSIINQRSEGCGDLEKIIVENIRCFVNIHLWLSHVWPLLGYCDDRDYYTVGLERRSSHVPAVNQSSTPYLPHTHIYRTYRYHASLSPPHSCTARCRTHPSVIEELTKIEPPNRYT
jgi:hypothetical protein